MLRPDAGAVLPVRTRVHASASRSALKTKVGPAVHCVFFTVFPRFRALVKRRRDGVLDAAASLIVPPVVGGTMPTHRCVPEDVDPELVFFCRHVYDFRYGRLLKNLQ